MSGSDRAFRLIVETLSQLEKERVGPLDAVPPMVDIAVSLALAAGGVDVAEEILGHVRKRIEEYRDGKKGALVTPNPRPKGGLSATAELFS